eukprot:COSAG04_NODE_13091_length_620_cov_1.514395_1_plen_68_part_10
MPEVTRLSGTDTRTIAHTHAAGRSCSLQKGEQGRAERDETDLRTSRAAAVDCAHRTLLSPGQAAAQAE